MKAFVDALSTLIIATTPQKEVRIAVIDTGFSNANQYKLCKPVTTILGSAGNETPKHGSLMLSQIAKGLQGSNLKYCFLLYDVSSNSGNLDDFSSAKGIFEAIKDKADIINMSYSGENKYYLEASAIDLAVSKKIILVAALGNNGKKQGCNTYPACYNKKVVIVSNKDDYASDDIQVDYYVQPDPGTRGTSYSAAIMTGILSLNIEKERRKIYEK